MVTGEVIEVTASPLATGMIVLAAVLGVAFWLTLVLLAARRPYFKHPHPDPMPGKVRGGMHLGDPRSLGPPEGERADVAAPPDEAGQAAGPGPAGPGTAAETGQAGGKRRAGARSAAAPVRPGGWPHRGSGACG